MSEQRTRAYRRDKDRQRKRKTKRVRKLWNASRGFQPGERMPGSEDIEDDARNGYLASTHCRPCSCSMCASDDQVPTRQEERARVSENEQRDEAVFPRYESDE